jgi:hypothetical protein
VSAYRVKIGGGRPDCAQDDFKKLPPPVQDELFTVVETELRPWPLAGDRDEGAVPDDWMLRNGFEPDGGWRWRRAITRANRIRINHGLTVPPAVVRASTMVIIFHVRPIPQRQDDDGWNETCSFTVWRVLSNAQLGPAIIRRISTLAQLSHLRPEIQDRPTG